MPQAPKSSRPQHPLPEYPRPALRRDSFESLNGVWQYAITKSAKLPPQWDGDILVPYSPEAKASGVMDCWPSHRACCGSLCTSIIRPSAPAAAAASDMGFTYFA